MESMVDVTILYRNSSWYPPNQFHGGFYRGDSNVEITSLSTQVKDFKQ